MGQLFYNLAVEVCHEYIIGIIKRPDIFITIFCSVWNWRTGISTQVCGCIDNMFTIFGEERTGGPSLSIADTFILELITRFFRHLAHEYLVALKTFFWISTLENDVFAIIAPISFCIISTESELL